MRRVSSMMISENSIRYIQQHMQRAARLQEQLAAEKTILRPSDDPGQVSHVMAVNSTTARNQQYMRNIDDGLAYLNQADTALGTIGDMLSDVKTKALQAANGTLDANDRNAIAQQIDKQIDALVDLGNSSLGGKYLFAGKKNNQPPFYRDPNTGDVYYRGDTQRVSREIVFGSSYEVDAAGVTAHDAAGAGVFGKLADPSDPANQIDDPLNPGQKMTKVTGGPLEALALVRDNLRKDDTEAIDQSLADLDDAIDVALVQRVAVGARTRHLEAVKDQLDDQNTKLEEILSNIQDADFAKLVVEVNQNDLVYQASLLTSSKILQVSLLNYL
ncbi:MAG: flagellar hook-associated protein FlgL [Pelotomaculum sp.]